MPQSKMKHIWSIVCQKGIVDNESNLLSIDSVFEQLTLPIPADGSSPFNGKDVVPVAFNCEVVTFWRRVEGDKLIEGDVLIKIMSPKKKEIANFPVKFEFPANMKNFRTKIKMNMLPVIDSGEYNFVILQKEQERYKTVAELPYEVILSEKGKNPKN